MRAWVAREWGDADSMTFEEVDEGTPPSDQVRIRIEAAAINFFDALMLQGTYQVKPEFPFTPGGEIAGTVIAAPEGSHVGPGDRVMAGFMVPSLLHGGYAEIGDTLPLLVRRIPDAMTFADAAAFNITYQTAYFALHRRAAIQPGEVLLVHGGAGGVGTACIQLGKVAGARVIATAGSDEKLEVCREAGADEVINYKTQDFAEEVKTRTGGKGADVVFDPVGGDVFDRSTKCIAWEGRIIVIGFTSGRIPEARANHLLVKNYGVLGLHWGAYMARNPPLVEEVTADLFRLYEEGKIKPVISATFPMAEAPAALKAVASGKSTGKVVLTNEVNGK